MNGINWDQFGANYVKFEEGKPKRVVLANWRAAVVEFKESNEKKAGIEFDVLEEDNSGRFPTPKTFQTSSVALISKIKPHCIAAEQEGKKQIDVTITRVGTGVKTQYAVVQNSGGVSAAAAAVNPASEAKKKLANAKQLLSEGMITEEQYNKMAARIEAEILNGN